MKKIKNNQRVRLRVLCEDRETARFVEQLAHRWGIGARQREIDVHPQSRGSGEQHVQRHFGSAVTAWRRVRHENVLLLIVIDGDNHGIARRRNELSRQLRDSGADPIAENDPVAIIVPTWHIETWIAWLCGHRPIHEAQRYKLDEPLGRDVARKIDSGEYSSQRAIDAWNPPAPDESTHVPSLTDARKELAERFGF